MSEPGCLTKKDERWIRKVLDHLCVLKGWKEVIDGPSFGLLISIADNYVVEKYLPLEQKNFLIELVRLGREKDNEGIKTLIAEKLNIDNPLLINLEQMALNFILKAIYEWAENIDLEINEEE